MCRALGTRELQMPTEWRKGMTMHRILVGTACFLLATDALAQSASLKAGGRDSQAIVGTTGTMYNGSNSQLTIPDDGSVAEATAVSSGTALGGRISGQGSGESGISRTGGAN